jgi:hypothetical protein
MDALSFIEKGWERAVALHNTSGVPWKALRGGETLVFAFDDDETGQEDAQDRAREAVLRGFEAHVLPGEEAAYGGKGDPNEALQAGTLDLSPLADLAENPPTGEDLEASDQPASAAKKDSERDGKFAEEMPSSSTDQEGPERPVAERIESQNGSCEPARPEDLVEYWNGEDIGYLGRWVWTAELPIGPVGESLYADPSLHRWIASELEKGPSEAENIERLRWVLWRLYAAYGPEDVPEWQIPDPPDGWRERSDADPKSEEGPYDFGPLPELVDTWRTEAPTPCESSPVGRGIALNTPYDEAFIQDLKSTLPGWVREWRGEENVWVVDDMVGGLVGEILRAHFG